MIPNWQDLAFDSIWKVLDAEFFKVKEAITSNDSRFDLFINKLLDNRDDEASFIPFLSIIPMQTCEYTMTIFTAGSSKNFSNQYKEKKHRLFSYYLMKGANLHLKCNTTL